MISLKTHNILDYVIGAVFVLVPYFMGLEYDNGLRNTFYFAGFGLIVYSALTQYQFSAVKWIPVNLHMVLDSLLGLYLILAPSIFGFRDVMTSGQYTTEVILGLASILFVLVTNQKGSADGVLKDVTDFNIPKTPKDETRDERKVRWG